MYCPSSHFYRPHPISRVSSGSYIQCVIQDGICHKVASKIGGIVIVGVEQSSYLLNRVDRDNEIPEGTVWICCAVLTQVRPCSTRHSLAARFNAVCTTPESQVDALRLPSGGHPRCDERLKSSSVNLLQREVADVRVHLPQVHRVVVDAGKMQILLQ